MITAHLYLRRKQKVRSAHVRIRYMRYAVQVATDTEKSIHYPEEIDRMKEQLDVEKSKSKSKIHNPGKREKRSIQPKKQEIIKGNTPKNANIFVDCRLARYERGVEQR